MNIYTNEILGEQRTREGLAHETFVRDFKARLHSDRDFRKGLARNLREAVTRAAYSADGVHTDQFLQNLSIGYRNDEYIGLSLMPVVPVSKRSDKYLTWDKRTLLSGPEDQIATRATPNEIEDSTSSSNYSVSDYALMGYVDAMTEANADEAYMDLVDQTESLAEHLALKEEMRIAAIMTASGSFGSNTAALTGVEWDEAAGSGNDPLGDIQSALAATWSGFGRTRKLGFTSLDVFNVLVNHAQISDRFKYVSAGLTTRQQLAQFFGLDDILVGAARKDTANIGQTASYSRVWSNVFGVAHVMTAPSRRIAAFGATFRFTPGCVTTQWFDPKPGNAGGMYTKVALSEDHQILAADSGYLLTGVIL